jgi:perosamine synthetase
MIPIAQPSIREEEISAASAVLKSGMLACGDVVSRFEREFAQYCKTRDAVGVNSGTAALHAGLLACGIRAGDEVIVPDFTFVATATSVLMCNARPVFADVDIETFNLNPGSLLEQITPKTRAVIGVHLFGRPFELRAVMEICEDHDLILIEDAAQAHGAAWQGERVGGFGRIGCFSFYPTKNMTTGEGGMVTTNDTALADRIRRIINHGQSEKYMHTELGYNYRMTNIAAAIGRVQLARLDEMNALRSRNAEYFSNHLSNAGLITPRCSGDAGCVYHQYVVRLAESFPMRRGEFMTYLIDNGIGSAIHYPLPVHRQPVFGAAARGCSNPVAEALAGSVLSIPVHPGVTMDECRYITDIIAEAG